MQVVPVKGASRKWAAKVMQGAPGDFRAFHFIGCCTQAEKQVRRCGGAIDLRDSKEEPADTFPKVEEIKERKAARSFWLQLITFPE